MPLISIVYTANLTELFDPVRLVDTVHETALALDCFPPYGIRTMATRAEVSRIGDGPDHAYVQISIRSAPGRPVEVRRRIVEAVFAATQRELAAVPHPALRFQVELSEFDEDTTMASSAGAATRAAAIPPTA